MNKNNLQKKMHKVIDTLDTTEEQRAFYNVLIDQFMSHVGEDQLKTIMNEAEHTLDEYQHDEEKPKNAFLD